MSIKKLSYFSQLSAFIILIFTSSFAQTKFAVIGDFGDDNADEQAVADLVNSWNVDFIITVGDNSYGSTPIDENIGKYFADWISNYVGSYGIGSPINKFFPSLGNHDYSDGDGINAYLDYFTLPGISGNSSGNENYYDYVIDNVHFFVIDSETDLSPQQLWLETQMINCEQNHSHWKIVYFHRPPYSSGQHGSSSSMRWDFLQWGADAILSGHDHNYERLLVDGLTYFVNGSGGRSLRGFGTILTDYSLIRYNDDFGAMLMEATDSTLTSKFYNTSGVLIDTWSKGDTITSVTLTVPNGGEKWTRGLNHQINWYDTFLEEVKIDLYKAGLLHSDIKPSTSSDGTTNWVIPDSTPIGLDYKIKISMVNDTSVYDFSDEYFSIASFEITVPNGGENWETGSFQQIKWNDNIPDADLVANFELWKGGVFEREIFVNERADGSKDWDIPTDLDFGTDYRIKIIHSNDSTDFDFSNADFTISSPVPSIILTAPNGSENWEAGTQYSIAWNDNISENVKIELFKGDFFDSEITVSTPSDGLYNWDIPAGTTPGSDYTIKITSEIDSGLFDFSDNYFTIYQSINQNDFTVDFLVQDNCSNSNILKFGTNSNATDCFDSTYDILASSQPSSSEYDSRFKNCGEDLIKDIRATNTDGSLIWDVHYQPTTGCEPVSFSWSSNKFPPQGNFYLVDPNGGGLVNINMRQDTTFTDNFGLN
ncbi:MAG: Ser-Thr-rich GPI-anchored membrane family protein, partial [Ignavibacteriaceae bacterium]